jgi:hypothetical protein
VARSAAAVVPSGLPRTQEEPLGARPRLTQEGTHQSAGRGFDFWRGRFGRRRDALLGLALHV